VSGVLSRDGGGGQSDGRFEAIASRSGASAGWETTERRL
jgi:hypothetical protein